MRSDSVSVGDLLGLYQAFHLWWGPRRDSTDLKGLKLFLHFLSREEKTKQKKTPVSRYTLRVVQPDDEAALHAAMRRCQSCSGAHNLAIAARLASIGALPDSMMLAASTG